MERYVVCCRQTLVKNKRKFNKKFLESRVWIHKLTVSVVQHLIKRHVNFSFDFYGQHLPSIFDIRLETISRQIAGTDDTFRKLWPSNIIRGHCGYYCKWWLVSKLTTSITTQKYLSSDNAPQFLKRFHTMLEIICWWCWWCFRYPVIFRSLNLPVLCKNIFSFFCKNICY